MMTPLLRRRHKKMLERLGYRVVAGTSPLDAMETLKTKPDFPIILRMGYNDPVSEAEAKSIGISEYVNKPMVI